MRAAQTRALFAGYNHSVDAKSGIDEDRLPEDAIGVIEYLPRALAIGLFSPFPSSWGERVSAPRLVGAIETSAWYLFFPGILLLLMRKPSYAMVFSLVFGGVIITLLGFEHPNVGTVYRQRFAYWMIALTIGAVGWARVLVPWLSTIGGRSRQIPAATQQRDSDLHHSLGGMDAVVAAGAYVMGVTLVCHLGFVARDLLLMRIFGVSIQLDAYYFAGMLLMFFVTSLAMPISDSLMRYFVEAHIEEGLEASSRLVRNSLWYAIIFLGSLAICLEVVAGPLMRLGLGAASSAEQADAAALFRCFLPILVLSAWTVIGNAALNALQRHQSAALAQMVVPAVTILFILSMPLNFGFYPAVLGMVLGTFLNAVVVGLHLRRLGIFLWPSFAPLRELPTKMVRSYRQLAIVSLAGAAVTPLGYTLAGWAGVGGISTWALTSKMIMLIGGLVNVGVGAIILPRISRLLR
jgi:O-antigen/teichoic acid export membrane protein